MTLNNLQKALGYRFQQADALELALTHRSSSSYHNERLEFLGDSVLNFVITDALYEQFATATEGELSRLRARLVKRETLAELARTLELGDLMRLGGGELKSGGFRRDSILADGMEALLGAIYKDGGIDAVRPVIKALYAQRLAQIDLTQPMKDPKTLVQEYLQARGHSVPEYTVVEVKGEVHDQHFTVECHIVALDIKTLGLGTSRRRAEQHAAEQ
ncbi:MAG: ribonuclease III, partial [Pseudomonadota bacterium]